MQSFFKTTHREKRANWKIKEGGKTFSRLMNHCEVDKSVTVEEKSKWRYEQGAGVLGESPKCPQKNQGARAPKILHFNTQLWIEMSQNYSKTSLKSFLYANISSHYSWYFYVTWAAANIILWLQFMKLRRNEKAHKWPIRKNVSIIISYFLLRGWARVIFNMQWGSFKVFWVVLTAVKMHQMHGNIL